MIDELITTVKKHLPLKVDEISKDEFNLNIRGKDWSLNTMSPFRFRWGDNLFGNDDEQINEVLNNLKGDNILEIIPFGSNRFYDFSLIFSCGKTLDIFSNSFYEPWVFRINGEITFVPSYQNPSYNKWTLKQVLKNVLALKSQTIRYLDG